MRNSALTPWNWINSDINPFAMQDRVIRHNLGSLSCLSRDLDKVFNQMLETVPAEKDHIRPKIDIHANDEGYSISAELPGIEEDDIKVDLKDGALYISGENKSEHKEDSDGYYRLERSYGKYKRVLLLPDDVDTGNIKASYKNGVLSIKIPKLEEKVEEVKSIEITKE